MSAPATRVVSNVSALGRHVVTTNHLNALDKNRAMYQNKEYQATWTVSGGKVLDEKSKTELRTAINNFSLRQGGTSIRSSSYSSSFSSTSTQSTSIGLLFDSMNLGGSHSHQSSNSASSSTETVIIFFDSSAGAVSKMWELHLTPLTPSQTPILTEAAQGISRGPQGLIPIPTAVTPSVSAAIPVSSANANANAASVVNAASNPASNLNWQIINQRMDFDHEDLLNVLNKNRIIHEGIEHRAILTKNHVKLDSKSIAELVTLMDTWDLTQVITSYRIEPDNSKTTIIGYKQTSAANAASAASEIIYRLEMTPLKPNEARLLSQPASVVTPSAAVPTPASSAATQVSSAIAVPSRSANATVPPATPSASPAILTAAALANANAKAKNDNANANPASAASAVSSASASAAKSGNDDKTPDKPAQNTAAVKPPVASTATAVSSKPTSKVKWKI